MKAHTKETQAAMTPESSLQALKDGNNAEFERIALEMVKEEEAIINV